MLVPRFLCGRYRDVLVEVRRRIPHVQMGWEAAMAGPQVDLAETPGLVVMHGPSPLLGSEPQIHIFLPVLELWTATGRGGTLPRDLRDRAFPEMLGSPWGTLALCSRPGQSWLIAPGRQAPMLEAAARCWPEIQAIGPRFSAGLLKGNTFWACTPSLFYAGGQLGLSPEAVQEQVEGGHH